MVHTGVRQPRGEKKRGWSIYPDLDRSRGMLTRMYVSISHKVAFAV